MRTTLGGFLQRRTKILLGVALVTLLAVAVATGFHLYRLKHPLASARVIVGTDYSHYAVAVVHVSYPDGRPVVGAQVYVHNDSGDSDGVTDSHGVTTIDVKGPDYEWISVNGVRVFTPSGSLDRNPGTTKGLTAYVTILEPQAFHLTP